jgi:hypothetical protein
VDLSRALARAHRMIDDIEARLVQLAIDMGHVIASPWTSPEDKRRLRAARRALDDAQNALLDDGPPCAATVSALAREVS